MSSPDIPAGRLSSGAAREWRRAGFTGWGILEFGGPQGGDIKPVQRFAGQRFPNVMVGRIWG